MKMKTFIKRGKMVSFKLDHIKKGLLKIKFGNII